MWKGGRQINRETRAFPLDHTATGRYTLDIKTEVVMQIAADFRNDSKADAVRVAFMFTAASVGVLYVNANRKATDIMDDASAAYKIATKRAAEKAGEAVAVELIRIVYPSR